MADDDGNGPSAWTGVVNSNPARVKIKDTVGEEGNG